MFKNICYQKNHVPSPTTACGQIRLAQEYTLIISHGHSCWPYILDICKVSFCELLCFFLLENVTSITLLPLASLMFQIFAIIYDHRLVYRRLKTSFQKWIYPRVSRNHMCVEHFQKFIFRDIESRQIFFSCHVFFCVSTYAWVFNDSNSLASLT